MKELAQISKSFNESSSEVQAQIVEKIFQKIILSNPLASDCEKIHQKQGVICPHCGKSNIIFNGKTKDIQNYYCKNCFKYFNQFSGSTISYIKKKEKLKHYLFLMLTGSSIEKCALGVKISIQTSFDWRHKIIAAIRDHVHKDYNGITELINPIIKFSRKGQGAKAKKIGQKGKITDPASNKKQETIEKNGYSPLSLVAFADRNQNFEIKVVQQGDLTLEQVIEQLGKRLNKVKKLCLNENAILKQFAAKKKISYFVRIPDKKVKGCNKYYHTDNIQMRLLKLDGFLERFRGVSSSYLQNYLYWYMMMDQILKLFDPSTAMIEKSISTINGKEIYKKCKMFA